MKIGRLLLKAGKLLGILAVLVVGSVAIIYFGARLLLREAGKNLISHAAPARDYAEAVARFEKLRLGEESGVNPLARSILLTHGVRTEKVIVFFHGYSSSPQQFRQLGERFYQLGYNVLVPLLPHHGMADRKLDTSPGCALKNCGTVRTPVSTSQPAWETKSL
jgi:hypothetical protein